MRTILWILFPALILIATACNDGKTQDSSQGDWQNIGAKLRQEKILVDDAALIEDRPKLLKGFYEANQALKKDFDIDFRVMTVQNEKDLDRFANRTFEQLQKKSRSQSGKALLLVIDPVKDQVRLEVSQALEPVYTDAFVSYLERKGMVPYFRDGKVIDGIWMMLELIRDRAFEAKAGKEFVEPMPSRSIGAGARTEAKLGEKDPDAKAGPQIRTEGTQTPAQIMRKYMQVLKSHNKNPDLEIYSKATRDFFRHWTVTEVNQNNEAKFLAPCLERQKTIYTPDGAHAVNLVLPLDENRKCSPYFFVKEGGKWRLDIASMAQSLRFNQTMDWHFDPARRLEGEGIYYAQAFDGYTFDRNGYPFRPDAKDRKPDDARWGFKCKGWYRPGDPTKMARCWIAGVWLGSPAEVRMGLKPHDYIYAVGEGAEQKKNASWKDFTDYMAAVPSGEIATVVVERYRKGEQYPYRLIRRGIAP